MERLREITRITHKNSNEIAESRLGLGMEKLDRDAFDPEKVYDKVAALGVKWIRIQSGWQKTEKEKGIYDFAWLDEQVDNLLKRGLKPWLCLCYGNTLYDELAKEYFGSVGCPPIRTEEAYTAWEKYVYETAKHFSGRIEYYEVWNESAKQLYDAIMILITAWNMKPGPIYNYLKEAKLYRYCVPYSYRVERINEILHRNNTSMRAVLNTLAQRNPNLREYRFNLLEDILHEADIVSYFEDANGH